MKFRENMHPRTSTSVCFKIDRNIRFSVCASLLLFLRLLPRPKKFLVARNLKQFSHVTRIWISQWIISHQSRKTSRKMTKSKKHLSKKQFKNMIIILDYCGERENLNQFIFLACSIFTILVPPVCMKLLGSRAFVKFLNKTQATDAHTQLKIDYGQVGQKLIFETCRLISLLFIEGIAHKKLNERHSRC